ncbi:hypothetical protein GYMLUDRAFT_51112 [Collybiopsis luxurians FD-317 M1]|uniref:Uncharacterized protein n=1 Tax=Collybiopsis luxurians FD-317 M1 TaxID=944289 RepID=A0A0D0B8W3_9AGAR|nr:hypothetical protein GYMLUDRAFT_51112 [Collybiopsis luxurians FD-317 M1]
MISPEDEKWQKTKFAVEMRACLGALTAFGGFYSLDAPKTFRKESTGAAYTQHGAKSLDQDLITTLGE